MIFSSILNENGHGLSKWKVRQGHKRSSNTNALKIKGQGHCNYNYLMASIFGISNYMNDNASSLLLKSSLYTCTVHLYWVDHWPSKLLKNKIATTIFGTHSSRWTFCYLTTLINKENLRDDISNCTTWTQILTLIIWSKYEVSGL